MKNLKFPLTNFITSLILLLIPFQYPVTVFGQDCTDSPSPIGQIDHRTDCPGSSCTANDVTLLGFELVGPSPCLDCTPGDVIEMTLFVVVDHGTNSNRPALVVMGDLSNGTSSCNFVRCDGAIIRNNSEPLTDSEYPSDGSYQKVNFGTFDYICGETLTFSNIMISWSTASANDDCPLGCPTSKCSRPAGTFVVSPPLNCPMGDQVVINDAFPGTTNGSIDIDPTSGKAPYSFTLGSTTNSTGNFSGLSAGNYTIQITDGNGCVVSCEYTVETKLITNPDVPDACPFLKVTLVLDESGSLADEEEDVEEAVLAYLSAVNETGTQVAIVEFSTNATQVANFTEVDDAFIATATNYLTNDYSPEGWTNWEAAFNQVENLNTPDCTANLVIFFTDGDPTAYLDSNNDVIIGGSVAQIATSLAEAVPAAQAVMAQGSHIFMLGVGGGIDENNLIAVSGPDEAPGVPLIEADYTVATFAELADCFQMLATTFGFSLICPDANFLGSYTGNNLDQIPICPTNEAEVEAEPYNMIVGDNPCGDVVVIACDDSTDPDPCNPDGQTITRSVTVIDDLNGNQMLDSDEKSKTCTYTYEIEYTPSSCCNFTATCPNDLDLGNYDCNETLPECATVVNLSSIYGISVGNSPCGEIVVLCSDSAPPNYCSPIGQNQTITRTVTVFDDLNDNGQLDTGEESESCNYIITILVDTELPEITCASLTQAQLNLGCNPTSFPTPSDFSPVVNDNCGADLSSSTNNAGTGCNRTYTITYTATDGCGNSNSCSLVFNYVVDDNADGGTPTLTCPTDADGGVFELGCNPETTNSEGIPNAIATAVPVADNCDNETSTSNYDDGAGVTNNGCEYELTRTFSYTDACNNTGTCTVTYTWTIDEDANGGTPTLTCPTDPDGGVIELGCNPIIIGSDGIPDEVATSVQVQDNCDNSTSTNSWDDGDGISNNGCEYELTRTFSYTDACNNTGTCDVTYTWTIDDNANGGTPTLTCPTDPDGGVIELGCNPIIIGSDGIPDEVATSVPVQDNCDNSTSTSSYDDGNGISNNGCEYELTRTFSYTDACNNTGTCDVTYTWTIDDNANGGTPTLTCPTDADGGVIELGCNPIIIGSDGIPDEVATSVPVQDNCDNSTSTNSWDDGDGISNNGCEYELTRTFSYTDACDNTGTCDVTYTWTIDDDENGGTPTLTCPTDADGGVIELGCNPETTNSEGIPDAVATSVTVEDNCDNTTSTSSYDDGNGISNNGCEYELTRTFSYTDACNNTGTCEVTYTWTIDDNENSGTPTLTCPTDPDGGVIELGCNPIIIGSDGIPDEVATSVPVQDNCDNTTSTNSWDDGDGISNNGCEYELTRTFSYTDACNNTGTCDVTYTWTIDDGANGGTPMLTCPTDADGGVFELGCNPIIIGSDGIPDEVATSVPVQDNCDNSTSTSSYDDGNGISNNGCEYELTRTFSYTDACNNTGTCDVTYTWTIDDNANGGTPTLTCPTDADGGVIELGCNPIIIGSDGIPDEVATSVPVQDNCDNSTSTNSWDDGDGISNNGCEYELTRTFSYTDACNNTGTCEVTYTWTIDDELPIVNCPTDQDETDLIELGCNPEGFNTSEGIPIDIPTSVVVDGNCVDENSTNNYDDGDGITNDGCTYFLTRTFSYTDNCNNTGTCSVSYSWIVDTSPPVIGQQPTINIQCAANVPPAGPLTAVDNCNGEITVEPTSETITGNCPHSFTIERTWTFVDNCNNTTSVSQTINVNDDTPPIAPEAPATLNLQCASDIPAPIDLTAIDNCDGEITVSPTAEVVDGNCPNSFTMTRTWTFTDGCGNTSDVSQTINVNDDTAPVTPVAPETLNLQCASDVPPPMDLTATDNCDGDITVSPTAEVVDGNCPNSFTMTRTWTFTDDCGNASDVSQTINVNDDTAPVTPVAPETLNLQCATDVPAPIDLTAIDNCDGEITVSPTAEVVDGNCPNSFTMTKTWTFTDGCGNTSDVSQTINVNDDTTPVIPVAPETLSLQCATDVPVPIDLTAIDNCDGEITISPTTEVVDGDCPNSFTMTRTWTFTDDCGNTSDVSQTINVNDDTAPVTPVAPETLNLQCATDVPAPIDLTAIDNCDGEITVSPTAEVVDGDCPNSFTMTRTWTFTDGCGNTSDVSQTINVNDDTTPVIPVAPETLNLQCTTDVPVPIDLTAIDNCDGEITVSPTAEVVDGNCPNSFTMTRTWTFTDDCGNTSDVSQTINVNDDTAPETPDAPETLNLQCASDVPPPMDLTATDNCDGEITVSPTTEVVDGDCPNSFTMTRTWTFTDGCGNTSDVSQTINVNDDTAPETPDAPETLNLQCASDAPPPMDLTATDNCDGEITVSPTAEVIDGDCPNSFTMTRTWTFTDDCGNTSDVSQTINVNDDTAPVTPVAPETLNLQCATDVPAPIDLTAIDNCDGEITVSPTTEVVDGESPNNFTMTRTWTFTDDCGNVSSVLQTINVNDDTDPEINIYPASAMIECDGNGNLTQLNDWLVSYAGMEATDNCAENSSNPNGVQLSYDTNLVFEEECGTAGRYNLTFTATDDAGNTTSATASFIITDTTAPIITSNPTNKTMECSDPLTFDTPTVADDCNEVTLVKVDVTTEGIYCVSEYSVTRTWTAIDACGNESSTVSQTIFLEDTTPPTMAFTHPLLEGMSDGETLIVDCYENAVFSPDDVNAEDACDLLPNVVMFDDVDWFDECHDGVMTRMYCYWEATDNCNNKATLGVFIDIIDNIPPTFAYFPPDITIPCGTSALNYDPPIGYNDCGVEVTALSFSDEMSDNDCVDGMTMFRTWTVEDICGNTFSRIQRIIYIDDDGPYFNESPENQTISCGQTPVFEQVTASDQCGEVVSLNYFDTPTTDGCSGGITRTWVATDDCGNESFINQSISFTDDELPVFSNLPDDLEISCDAIINFGNPTITDNCDTDITLSISDNSTEGCNIEYTRTWTATDDCGNTTAFTQTITTVDTEGPTFTSTPQDFTVPCDNNQLIFGSPIAVDNCQNATVTSNDVTSVGDCNTGYTVTRTWTATDGCGNVSSISQTATVLPESSQLTFAFAYVPDNMTISCNDEMIFGTPIGNTTCNTFEMTHVDLMTEGDCEGEYAMTRTWSATDECGTAANCQQTINVVDDVAPFFTYVPENTSLDCTQEVTFGTPTCDDACSHVVEVTYEDQVIEGCGNSYSITRTWTSVDHCGNTATASQTLNVFDDTAPIFVSVLENKNIDCGQPVLFDTPLANDACSIDYTLDYEDQISSDDCSLDYVVTRIWTATDACGNISTQSQSITRPSDTTAPTFSFIQGDKVVGCAEEIVFEDATAFDNCSSVTVSSTDEIFNGSCLGTFTQVRTWTATDDCGNITTASRSITMEDNEAPTFVYLPQNSTVTCEQNIEFGDIQVADNCDNNVSIEFSDETTIENCESKTTRTWIIFDICGNMAMAQRTITRIDGASPTLDFAPQNEVIGCGQNIDFDQPLASDNCSEIFMTHTDEVTQGNCPSNYNITRTWTLVDACGNATSTSKTIEVIDNIAPIITESPADLTINCSQQPVFGNITAEDNCDEFEVSFEDTQSSGDCESGYQVTRNWTVVDPCENVATASQTIFINNTSTIEFTATPNNLTVDCGSTMIFGTPEVFTTCGNTTLTYSDNTLPGSCDASYSTTRTWTAEDDCENIITTSQTITVFDNSAPIFTNIDENLFANCNEEIPLLIPETFDACGNTVLNYTDSQQDGTCPRNYSIIRTWSATDDCGNVSHATQVILIEDAELPTFENEVADKEITCNEPLSFDTPNYYDTCSDVAIQFNDQLAINGCEILTTRTWTIMDECGNSASTSQTITQVDEIAPVFTSIPSGMTIDCNTTPQFGTPITDENCSQVTLTFVDETSAGDCSTGYSITRTWTAVDACGNTSTASQTIVVSENTTVAFSFLPADQYLSCNEDVEFGTPEIASNCSEDVEITYEDEMIEGSCASEYSITRTWTANACNIEIIASATITVSDDQLPVLLTAPANKVTTCGIDLSFDAPTFIDNCSNASITYTDAISNDECEYNTTRTWTIVDACGNAISTSQTITQVDEEAPLFVSIPEDLVIDCNTTPQFGTPIVEDNCGQIDLNFDDITSAGDCSSGFTIIRTWTAADVCGNEATASQTILVNQETAISFSFLPADQQISCDASVEFGTPVVSSNCTEDVELTYEDQLLESNCSSSYSIQRIWTATACDIAHTASATITIVDNEMPTMVTLPNDKYIACGEAPVFDEPTYFDNCSETSISFEDATFTNDCEVSITRTWTIVDACGNANNTSQTITSTDNESPTFVTAPQNVVIDCNTTPQFETPTVVDNCGQATLNFEDTNTIGDCSSGYSMTRTWTAIDECGNETAISQMITVSQETSIAFTFLPADQVLTCEDEIYFEQPIADTNCDESVVVSYEDVMLEGSCEAAFSIVRTWTLTACDVSLQASTTLTIIDNTSPVVNSTPTDKFISCNDELIFDTPTFDDACSEVSILFEDVTNTSTCETGVAITRTWMLSDACGNQTSIAQTITREVDVEVPVFTFVPANKEVNCNEEIEFEQPEFLDNCSTVTLTFDDNTEIGSCENGNAHIRTWTAVDGCGNTAVAFQTIYVTPDEEGPIFTFVPDNQELICIESPIFGEATAIDNCSEVTITFEDVNATNDCDEAQVFTRTWTAIDDCGNTSNVSQVLTILPDEDAPEFTFVPADLVVNCDAIIEDQIGTASAADNCGMEVLITYTDEVIETTCGLEITRTWFAADNCNNVMTATSTILTEDMDQPELEYVPADLFLNCNQEIPMESAIFTDNCDVELEYHFEEAQVTTACGYQLIRTWTATDNCENISSISQQINVEDIEAPQFDMTPNSTALTYEMFFDMELPQVTATDDCTNATVFDPIISDNGDCDDFKYKITWNAMDDCGNETAQTMTVPILDAVMDLTIDGPNSIVQDEERTYKAIVAFGLAPYTYEWKLLEGTDWQLVDNEDQAVLVAGKETGTFEVIVTDANGCSTSTIIEVESEAVEIIEDYFYLYPNPTYGDLTIDYTSAIEGRTVVTVYDVLGRELVVWNFDALEGFNKHNLNVEPLAEATYVIKVKTGKRIYTQKFVKLN